MEYPVHIAGIRPDTSKCSLVASAQDEFELRNQMIDAIKDGLIIVPVTLETARCSWGQLVSDVCVMAVGGKPGGEALTQKYADVLRSLASYVGAGGYNVPDVNPDEFEEKICRGIDKIASMSSASGLVERAIWRDITELPHEAGDDVLFWFARSDGTVDGPKAKQEGGYDYDDYDFFCEVIPPKLGTQKPVPGSCTSKSPASDKQSSLNVASQRW